MSEETDGGPVLISYVLDLPEGGRVDESEAVLEEYAPSIRAGEYCEGAILVTAPGQDPLAIDDALPFLVKELCFRSLPRLMAGQDVTIHLFMSGRDVDVSFRDGLVVLALAGSGSVAYERSAMLLELFECGARFTDFHTRLWSGDPDKALDVANLEKDREEGRIALAG